MEVQKQLQQMGVAEGPASQIADFAKAKGLSMTDLFLLVSKVLPQVQSLWETLSEAFKKPSPQ